MNTKPLIQDEIITKISEELGLEKLTDETKQWAIVAIGENAFSAIIVEILQILPTSKHEEFRVLLGTASPLRMHTYLEPYIVDFPAFMQRIVAEEVAETKKLLTQS
jgi:hypothetical protein